MNNKCILVVASAFLSRKQETVLCQGTCIIKSVVSWLICVCYLIYYCCHIIFAFIVCTSALCYMCRCQLCGVEHSPFLKLICNCNTELWQFMQTCKLLPTFSLWNLGLVKPQECLVRKVKNSVVFLRTDGIYMCNLCVYLVTIHLHWCVWFGNSKYRVE